MRQNRRQEQERVSRFAPLEWLLDWAASEIAGWALKRYVRKIVGHGRGVVIRVRARLKLLRHSWAAVPDASLENATRVNDYTVFLSVRNQGREVLRIVRYSIDKFEPVIRIPLRIEPGGLANVAATRDLSYTTLLEKEKVHEITFWDESGWAFTFPFRV